MEARDLPLLEALEAIVVRGTATLPGSAIRIFKDKGKAGSYEISGNGQTINGYAQWGHRQLAGGQSAETPEEPLSVTVNGCLRFDDDVTEEDLDRIAAVYCNGAVLLPPHLKAVLAPRVKQANGFIGDEAEFEKITGRRIGDFIIGYMGKGADADTDEAAGKLVINTGSYFLV
jgi:hypothetical protein